MGSVENTVDSEHAVIKIYNSAIAAAAIPAAWEVGLLDAVLAQKKVDIKKYAAEHNLDGDSMLGLVVVLNLFHVVRYDQGHITAGGLFDETYQAKSFSHWLALGSGGLFSRMQHLLRKENRVGDYYQRDPVAIAFACRELSHCHYDPIFWAAMERLDFEFHSVVDLGCGSGERLIQILERFPATTAIGIDVAASAISFAESESRKRSVQGRLLFVVDDARNLAYREDFLRVDLITCFMMGHDFWPRENCIKTLRKFRQVFPNVRRFILGDATRGLLQSAGSKPPVDQVNEDNVPIFNLGFEFGHILMDTYIPTRNAWHDVFGAGGWRLVKEHELPKHAFAVMFELEPAD